MNIVEEYGSLLPAEKTIPLTLTREEMCAVLSAYDYGIDVIAGRPETAAVLDVVIGKLKSELWP